MSDWTRKTSLFSRSLLARASALALLTGSLCAGWTAPVLAQAPQGSSPAPAPANRPEKDSKKPTVFKVKYVSDDTVYLEAGLDADLQEGMKLSVVEAPPDGVIAEGIQYRGYAHVAEIVVSSISDSSAVCEVVKANGEINECGFRFLIDGLHATDQ